MLPIEEGSLTEAVSELDVEKSSVGISDSHLVSPDGVTVF